MHITNCTDMNYGEQIPGSFYMVYKTFIKSKLYFNILVFYVNVGISIYVVKLCPFYITIKVK